MKKLLNTPEGILELEFTADEIIQKQIDDAQEIVRLQQEEADKLAREEKIAQEKARKESAIAKLKALGLTEEEVKSIL